MQNTYDWWLSLSQLEYYSWFDNVFTIDEITTIEKLIADKDLFLGKTNDDINIEKRNSGIKFLQSSAIEHRWIFERLTSVILNANEKYFQFDLDRIETLQYTTYKQGQFYKDHLDLMYQSPSNAIRKLSFTVQLSDPDSYQGGNLHLKIGPEPTLVPRTQGTVIFFPSYILHEVTPVEQGVRKSLVGWVTGPRWK